MESLIAVLATSALVSTCARPQAVGDEHVFSEPAKAVFFAELDTCSPAECTNFERVVRHALRFAPEAERAFILADAFAVQERCSCTCGFPPGWHGGALELDCPGGSARCVAVRDHLLRRSAVPDCSRVQGAILEFQDVPLFRSERLRLGEVLADSVRTRFGVSLTQIEEGCSRLSDEQGRLSVYCDDESVCTLQWGGGGVSVVLHVEGPDRFENWLRAAHRFSSTASVPGESSVRLAPFLPRGYFLPIVVPPTRRDSAFRALSRVMQSCEQFAGTQEELLLGLDEWDRLVQLEVIGRNERMRECVREIPLADGSIDARAAALVVSGRMPRIRLIFDPLR